jgi:hypothetical protein
MSPPTAKKTKLEAQKPNFELANMLAELADYEKNVNRQIYKYNAYRKAVRSIIDYPAKITSIEDTKNLVFILFFLFKLILNVHLQVNILLINKRKEWVTELRKKSANIWIRAKFRN